MLDFELVVLSNSIATNSSGLLNFENMSLAIGNTMQSIVEVEIYAVQVCRPPSWIFNFQFLLDWSYSINTKPIGLPDSENVGIAVEIALLSILQVVIYAILDCPLPFPSGLLVRLLAWIARPI